MKFVRMLILALGLVMLITAPSFATVQFVTSSTTTTIATNAQTGLTGSIFYTPLATGNITINTTGLGEVINVTYPTSAPISFLSDIVVSVKATTAATTPVAFNECFGCTTAQTAAGQPYAGSTSIANAAFATYGTTQVSTVSGISVTVTQNGILIGIANSLTFTPADFVKVDGVRVDVSSFATNGTYLTANLSNSLGQAVASNNQLQVSVFSDPLVNGFLSTPAMQGVAGTAFGLNFYTTFSGANGSNTAGVVLFNTGTSTAPVMTPQNQVTITLGEVFANAFETSKNANNWNNTKITLNLTSIPTGLAISGVTFVGLTSISGSPLPVFANACPGQFTCPNAFAANGNVNPITVLISSSRSNALEGLQVGITFSATSGTTSLALNPPPIGYTITLAPAGPVIPAGNPNAGAPDYPFNSPVVTVPGYFTFAGYKYASKTISGAIPVTITSLVTNLLAPFAMATKDDGHASGYSFNTGFAIANTSGTGPTAFAAPKGLDGTITVILYPFNGSGPFSFNTGDTADTKKIGLAGGLNSSTGALPSKATWIFLLNDLLAPAKYTGTSFQGFIRFQCNFQAGVGISYIADGEFDVSAQGYQMLSDVPIAASPLPVGGYF